MRKTQCCDLISQGVLRHPQFTTYQICLTVFPIIIHLCPTQAAQHFRDLLLSVPKEILKSSTSHLPAMHPSAPFYIPSVKRELGIPPGCRMGSSEDISTQFAAKPLPHQLLSKPLLQPLTWNSTLHFQLHVMLFFGLFPNNKCYWHSSYVGSWVVRIRLVLPALLTQLAKLPPDISAPF